MRMKKARKNKLTRFQQLKETLNVRNIDQAVEKIIENTPKHRRCASKCGMQSNTRDCGNQCEMGVRMWLEQTVQANE